MFWSKYPRRPENSDDQIRARPDSVELSETALFEASIAHILNEGLGFRKSAQAGISMLGDERIIPMMSYGLVEYLSGLDLSAFELLELGGGHSTEFWAQRTRSVITLETDPEWARILQANAFPNAQIRSTSAETIAADIKALDRAFDAIVVDASANRYACAKAALEVLKPGGFILLDNADWYPNATALLRAADLIQVDFHDFRPLRWYRLATSLFLHKDFRPRPLYNKLPYTVIGGKDIAAANEWDRIE